MYGVNIFDDGLEIPPVVMDKLVAALESRGHHGGSISALELLANLEVDVQNGLSESPDLSGARMGFIELQRNLTKVIRGAPPNLAQAAADLLDSVRLCVFRPGSNLTQAGRELSAEVSRGVDRYFGLKTAEL